MVNITMMGEMLEAPSPAVPGPGASFPRGRKLFGRTVIYTDAEYIDASNVVEELNHALFFHSANANQINYLYWYRRGKQPILGRKKEIRPEICNTVIENHAEEIVAFKDGYLLGEPLQYVGVARKDKSVTEKITTLNRFMQMEDKAAKDAELAEWFHTCGTSYRMALPKDRISEDEAPFSLYTLDPRFCFVVYYNGLGHRPMMGVKYVMKRDRSIVFSVYTDNCYFEIEDDQIVREESHVLGAIPIIEYPANKSRIGSFEVVLPILDAINNVESNRMDGIEQFIQSIMKFVNADISEDDFLKMAQMGAIKIKSEQGNNSDVSYMTQELNQTQTQVTKDDLYDAILTICGMPNRNGGSSTSDTGAAVIMRDGWSAAEARAKKEELLFKKSENQFLRIALRCMATFTGIKLGLSEMDIRFTRRNYENIQQKSQVLTTMLANPKIHPKLAFVHCGLFADPDAAYEMSQEWAEEQEAKAAAEAKKFAEGGGNQNEPDVKKGEQDE